MVARLDALLEAFLGPLALALEGAAGAIILVGAVKALAQFARHALEPVDEIERRLGVRHNFGRNLLLALDFTIGADLLKVASAPSLEAVTIAGLVVLVRIALTLVLQFELAREERAHHRP